MEEDEDNQNELCPNDMKNKVIAPGAENQNQSMMVLDIHSSPIPPFLLKIYDMLANDDTHAFVSWTPSGTSFVIKDPHSFSTNVLPMYFRHNNFQSFVTQLNSYVRTYVLYILLTLSVSAFSLYTTGLITFLVEEGIQESVLGAVGVQE